MDEYKLQLIEEAKEKRFKSIYLSNCKLTEISLLKDLLNLSKLYLSNNQLRNINGLKNLINLTELYLSNNQLTDVSGLVNMLNLTKIYLSNNQLTDANAFKELQNLEFLNLSNNRLTDVSGLTNLPNLTELDLSNNHLTDVSGLAHLPNLTKLYLSNNQLTNICGLTNLPNLKLLDLSNNKLTDISGLAELPNLTEFYLFNNQLTDTIILKDLPNLELLNLSNNLLTDISGLTNLPTILKLYLSNNQLTFLNNLTDLPNLKELYLFNNHLTDVSGLAHLPNLTKLYLSNNQLTNICGLTNLPNLIELDLCNNQLANVNELTDLPNLKLLKLSNNYLMDVSGLSNLPNFTELYLSNNRLTNVSGLANLIHLIELDLSNNQLTDVSGLAELPNLKMLNLSNNQLKDILPIKQFLEKGVCFKWKNDNFGSRVILEGNPLTTPPREIIEQGEAVIMRYFNEIKKGKNHKINESRLLIVGQGGSGKTSLRRKLKDINAALPEPGDTTRGIETDILEYNLHNQSYKLRIWDFGGQNIQHYAHQFFLTDSSLYVLLTNEREQNTNFQYWLNIIEILGGKSPVLIVQNEIAGHCEEIRNIAGIRSRYENVVNIVYSTDLLKAKEDARFENLRREILHLASKLEHVNKEYPISYLNVRDRLDKETEQQKHYITISHYKQICKEEGILNEELVKDIASTYSILGICLYIKDDIELRNYIFLNPQWIIDALFGLLYHDLIIKQNGEFSEEDTLLIWIDPTYENMHGKLLRMMERFELCYRIVGENRFIVPQRLPAAKESYHWREESTTKVLYNYQFMPKGIITRITCRLHDAIMKDRVWSDAVVFENRGAKVFIREVYSEEKLSIEATGTNKEELLNRVIDTIDAIHSKSKIANLKVEKLVPCICSQCATAKEPYFFNYDTLCLLLKESELDERCQKSLKKVDIREVLYGTGIKLTGANKKNFEDSYASSATNKLEEQKLKVFISYSKHDDYFKNQLLNHLATLKRTNDILTWNDADLVPSEDWNDRIRIEIANSQIILLLVSPNFITTDYIWDSELKEAYRRVQNNEMISVVPIIVDFCSWERLPFAKYNVLPRKGDPVTNTRVWVNQNHAWKDVMEGIERVIGELKNKQD